MKDDNFDNYHALKLIESLTSIIEKQGVNDSVVEYLKHTLDFIPWNDGVADAWIELLKLVDGQLKEIADNPQNELEGFIKELSDHHKQFEVYELLITNYFKRNQFEDALTSVNEQILLAEKLDSATLKSRSYQTKGVLYHVLGQMKKAEEWYLKSYQFIEIIEGDQLKDRIIYSLANLYQHYLGDFEKSSKYYQEGYNHATEGENKERQGFYLDHLGMSYYSQGKYEDSIKFHDKAWGLLKDQERNINVLFHKVQLSQALSKLGRYERIGEELAGIIDLKQTNSDPYSNCWYFLLLAEFVENEPDNYDKLAPIFSEKLNVELDKISLVEKSKKVAYKTKHVPSMVNSNVYLAKFRMENDPAEAMSLLSEAKQLAIQNNRYREERTVKEFVEKIGLDYATL